MKRLLALPLLAIFVVSGAYARGPTPSGATALIQLEHTWLQAILGGNKATLRTILASDFVDTSYTGTLRNKQDILASTQRPPRYHAALSGLRVRIFGDAAIVTGLNTVTGPGNAWTAKLRFTDVFIRRDDRWQAVGAQESMLHATSADAGANK